MPAGLLALSSSLSTEQEHSHACSEVDLCSTVLATPPTLAHMGTVSACAMAETPESPLWSAPWRRLLPTPC